MEPFNYQLIQQNELLSKCWLAGTNWKTFHAHLIREGIQNVDVAKMCDYILYIINLRFNMNITGSISFKIPAYLFSGLIRIYQQQVNILYDQTKQLTILNKYCTAQGFDFENINLICEPENPLSVDIESLFNEDLGDDEFSLQKELEKFLADGEKQLRNIVEINRTINLREIEWNDSENLNNNENDDIFDELTDFEISNFINIREGCEIISENNLRNSSINSIQQIRTYDKQEEFISAFNESIVGLPENIIENDDQEIRNMPLDSSEHISKENQNISENNSQENVPLLISNLNPLPLDDIEINNEIPFQIIYNNNNTDRRKRKKIKDFKIDQIIKIPYEQMKEQVNNYSDTQRCTNPKFDIVKPKKINYMPSTIAFLTPSSKSSRNYLFYRNLITKKSDYDESIIRDIVLIDKKNLINNSNTKNIHNDTKIQDTEQQLEINSIIPTFSEEFNDENEITIENDNQFENNEEQEEQQNQTVNTFDKDQTVENVAEKIPIRKTCRTIKYRFTFETTNDHDASSIISNSSEHRRRIKRKKMKDEWNKEEILKKLKYSWDCNEKSITMKNLCANVNRLTASIAFANIIQLNASGDVKLKQIDENLYIEPVN